VRADLIEVFKITHGYSSVTLETFFEIDSATMSQMEVKEEKNQHRSTTSFFYLIVL